MSGLLLYLCETHGLYNIYLFVLDMATPTQRILDLEIRIAQDRLEQLKEMKKMEEQQGKKTSVTINLASKQGFRIPVELYDELFDD